MGCTAPQCRVPVVSFGGIMAEGDQVQCAIGHPIRMRVWSPSLDALDEARLGVEFLAHLVPILNFGIRKR